jgi:hypothetical protein
VHCCFHKFLCVFFLFYSCAVHKDGTWYLSTNLRYTHTEAWNYEMFLIFIFLLLTVGPPLQKTSVLLFHTPFILIILLLVLIHHNVLFLVILVRAWILSRYLTAWC